MTREDNFPTVNLEAIACGTPVLTFNTGGSPEPINENTGVIIDSKKVEDIIEIIDSVFNNFSFSRELCVLNAKEYDRNLKFKEYLKLYKTI